MGVDPHTAFKDAFRSGMERAVLVSDGFARIKGRLWADHL